MLALSLGALGVVFGDIGTSPLYAFRQAFAAGRPSASDPADVLGVLSLMFWALVLAVSIKYVVLILRADNEGEGGILALMQLVLPEKGRRRGTILALGLVGAALLYGDGTITPAISVLSAVEGLGVATPVSAPFILVLTLVILFFVFAAQARGTGRVGMLFGPIMLVWFPVIGVAGLLQVIRHPLVLAAISPHYAVAFFRSHGLPGLATLGPVFLVVTGGEALYADIGHFGRRPIRLAWFALAFPCLLLNYFGQGALALRLGTIGQNPFFQLLPPWALYPMVALATLATIIASQAIISGAFSLTFQAVQLGYLPRLAVVHTSAETRGQIYMPQVNWLLFAATTLIVLGFRSSGNLAAAYGVAVSMTMAITTVLAFSAMRQVWSWRLPVAILIVAALAAMDFSFLGANLLKVPEGGWYPLMLGAFISIVIATWIGGQRRMARLLESIVQPLAAYLEGLDMRRVKRVPGTAVYLSEHPFRTPPAFILNVNHNHVVHRRVLFVSVSFKGVPRVRADERLIVEPLGNGFYRVLVKFGFMDRTDLRAVFRSIRDHHLAIDLEATSFFVGRRTPVTGRVHGLQLWRERLYLFMVRNSGRIVDWFNLPPDRVFEVGTRFRV